MDIVLWAIVAAFAVWEVVAHFVFRNRGAHTLSNRIWALEKRYPKTRAATALACLLLALHLTVHWI